MMQRIAMMLTAAMNGIASGGFCGAGDLLWDQTAFDIEVRALVDQEFDDFPDFSGYLVTDIDTGGEDWKISDVTTYFTNALDWANADITQGRLNIIPQDGDLPDNAFDPRLGRLVDITIIDLGAAIAVVAADLNIELAAGEYWIGLAPLVNFGQFGQEFHLAAPIVGVDTAWRNPGGGFALGEDWSTTAPLSGEWVGLFDAAIGIGGEISKGGGRCPCDLDGDDFVGTGDLILLLGAWGLDPNGPPDFDGDGNVGAADLIELLGNWGPCR